MRSWKIGTAFGIGIYVHWTFLLLVGYVLYSGWGTGGLERALFSVTLLFGVFACVALHELGHALVARYFGIPTRDIILSPIGGVARLERMSERPWEEFWIAIAGPLVNVVLAALLVVPAVLLSSPGQLQSVGVPRQAFGNFFLYLLSANILLVLFNLLPAFPMDGGRVLRALLAAPLGRVRATEVAAGLGAVFALIFALLGLGLFPNLVHNPFLLFIGAVIYLFGRQELTMVRQQEYLRRRAPLDVIPADAEVLEVVAVPDDHRPEKPSEAFSGMTWDDRSGVWVVWRNGQPVHSYWVE